MGSMKTALVRGASSGMGRETAKRLVEMSEEFLGRRAALDDDAFDT
jgi:NAD(P)-dependent dehydrogenase (short-subunit alcohol dehydrogenase family)